MAKKYIKLGIKSVNKGKEKGTFEFIASNASVDRDGEVIDPKGWDIKNFQKNPIILWAHNYKELPIGIAEKITKTADSLKITIKFASKEANEKADQVRQLVEEGILKTVSVGFIPKQRDEKDNTVITEAELLEVSLVPVPSNPDALALAVAKGYSKDLFRLKKAGHKPPKKPKKQPEICDPASDKYDPEACAQLGKKDVGEVIALSGVLDHLSFLIFMFEQNAVAEKVTDRMNDALKLIMEAVKMEATMGKKEFKMTAEEIFKQRKRTDIQTIILSKEVFKTVEEARAWAKDNDFKSGKVDENETSFRFRQFSPGMCQDGSFRTINLTEGVSAVICKVKKGANCEQDNLALISHLTERIVSELVGGKNPSKEVEERSDTKEPSANVEIFLQGLRKRSLEKYKHEEKTLTFLKNMEKKVLIKMHTHEQDKTHKKGA